MSHTTEQAIELWCPMARAALHEVVRRETAKAGDIVAISEDHRIVAGCNIDVIGGTRVPELCRCIADKCAMWRWVPGGQKNRSGARHPTIRGYCGLAGRPELMP